RASPEARRRGRPGRVGLAPTRRFHGPGSGQLCGAGADPGVRGPGGRGVPTPPRPAARRRDAGHRGLEDGGRDGPRDRGLAGLRPEHRRAAVAADPTALARGGGAMSATDPSDLPLRLALHVDDVCRRFEAAWKASAAGGERPRLESYLANTDGPARAI